MIHYVTGDATRPEDITNVGPDFPAVIVHCCNNKGGWGKGFVVALSNRWSEPEANYRFHAKRGLMMGSISMAAVEPGLSVCNLIGQDGYRATYDDTSVHVSYEAILRGMKSLALIGWAKDATIHMPRIGCGLAGGTWDQIEPCLQPLTDAGLEVFVYDLP